MPELPKEEEKMRTGVVEKPFHHENMFIGASVIQTSPTSNPRTNTVDL